MGLFKKISDRLFKDLPKSVVNVFSSAITGKPKYTAEDFVDQNYGASSSNANSAAILQKIAGAATAGILKGVTPGSKTSELMSKFGITNEDLQSKIQSLGSSPASQTAGGQYDYGDSEAPYDPGQQQFDATPYLFGGAIAIVIIIIILIAAK